MDQQAELSIVRAAYTKQILAVARVHDPRLAAAFGAIPWFARADGAIRRGVSP